MIFVDTGVFFGLADDTDKHHVPSKDFYTRFIEKEKFVSSLPIVLETWQLIEARLGGYKANRFWKWILDGYIELLSVQSKNLFEAYEIEMKYSDVGLGFVDATTFALCEQYRIDTVFTVDRKHFGIYRPKFTSALKLVPEI